VLLPKPAFSFFLANFFKALRKGFDEVLVLVLLLLLLLPPSRWERSYKIINIL
jgi:hypothetical protein